MEKAQTTFKNNSCLRAAVFAASIFLIFLGMRNPYLSHNHGPRQRPRAVLEKVAKASEEAGKKAADVLESKQPVTFSPVATSCSRYVSLSSQFVPGTTSFNLIARAPPTAVSLAS